MSTVLENIATIADYESLPDDGIERWLVRGQLRERPENGMTKRNRWHSQILITIGTYLKLWRDRQPEPRGVVLGGEAGCILQRNPDTVVGIDIAYFGPDIAAMETEGTTLMDGPPVLAVEILSPSDRQQDIDEKTDLYQAAGVPLVWLVDPHLRTVTVLRLDQPPRLFNETDTFDAEPHLPGFKVSVAGLFD
ncbi:MAG TPA: Uma2 family endonuclease [Planctomycetaceae bacterium]|nr:Uma2 family endonuclease [Planctomycetaceae bacterium]